MATANLFNREVSANKSPRNAFDLGYSTLFSSPCGQLLPCGVWHVERGDKLKVGVTSLTRSNPIVTGAYMSFDEKLDFWFVPRRLLWSDYDNWKVGQTFRHRTTNLKGSGTQNFEPFTSFQSVSDYLKIFTSPPNGLGMYFAATPATTLRYLDLLNYSVPNVDGLFNDIKLSTTYSESVDNPVSKLVGYYSGLDKVAPMNYARLAAFQCIYMHGYRNEEFEELDPSFYNCDNLFNQLSFDNTLPATVPAVSMPSYLIARSPNEHDALYQRLTLEKLFTPRFKNWRKDLFTSVKPNPGFNLGVTGLEIGTDSDSSTPIYGSGFYDPYSNIGKQFPDAGYNTNNDDGRYNPLDNLQQGADYDDTRRDWTFQVATSSNPASVVQRLLTKMNTDSTTLGLTYLYPQNIRNLMAQDKFTRAAIYADKDLSSQIKALFGESYSDPNRPVYLGSYSAMVQIDDVVAQGNGEVFDDTTGRSTPSILGQTAGRVKQGGQDGRVFSREFSEDGIVMGVHYIMPRNNYDSYRLDKWNTKVSRFDYYWPQFDGLGYQPVLSYERKIESTGNGLDVASSLFGFAPRYYEYKTRQNEVHGVFMAGQSDEAWTLSNNGVAIADANDPQVYKILPDITDRIFTLPYDGGQSSDPFKHYYNFEVTYVSNKEVYGTASL